MHPIIEVYSSVAAAMASVPTPTKQTKHTGVRFIITDYLCVITFFLSNPFPAQTRLLIVSKTFFFEFLIGDEVSFTTQ